MEAFWIAAMLVIGLFLGFAVGAVFGLKFTLKRIRSEYADEIDLRVK
jgi:hypothetical protein